MLKKLVKYGNSNALVLDKALLELLNISEGSIVKIKTDGKSLIITPQEQIQETLTKTITPQETLEDVIQNSVQSYYKNPEDAQAYMHELRTLFARYAEALKVQDPQELQKILNTMDQEVRELTKKYPVKTAPAKDYNFSSAVASFKEVHEKYRHVQDLFVQLQDNPEYIHKSVLLAEKYEATKNSPEYIKEFISLVSSYIPEYSAYQEEIMKVGQTLS